MSFEEQIMFKDKYPSTFSRQMEAIVFIILSFRNTRDFENLEISLGYSPVLAGGYSVMWHV